MHELVDVGCRGTSTVDKAERVDDATEVVGAALLAKAPGRIGMLRHRP
jgi:hypothetical protein